MAKRSMGTEWATKVREFADRAGGFRLAADRIGDITEKTLMKIALGEPVMPCIASHIEQRFPAADEALAAKGGDGTIEVISYP